MGMCMPNSLSYSVTTSLQSEAFYIVGQLIQSRSSREVRIHVATSSNRDTASTKFVSTDEAQLQEGQEDHDRQLPYI